MFEVKADGASASLISAETAAKIYHGPAAG
jgi:hypothetical protein